MRIEERIVNARNNQIVLKLTVDDPLTGVAAVVQPNRVQVAVGATLLDSAVNPEYFDFTVDNIVRLKLGAASLVEGRYLAKLYVFDAAHAEGLLWVEFIVEVVS